MIKYTCYVKGGAGAPCWYIGTVFILVYMMLEIIFWNNKKGKFFMKYIKMVKKYKIGIKCNKIITFVW